MFSNLNLFILVTYILYIYYIFIWHFQESFIEQKFQSTFSSNLTCLLNFQLKNLWISSNRLSGIKFVFLYRKFYLNVWCRIKNSSFLAGNSMNKSSYMVSFVECIWSDFYLQYLTHWCVYVGPTKFNYLMTIQRTSRAKKIFVWSDPSLQYLKNLYYLILFLHKIPMFGSKNFNIFLTISQRTNRVKFICCLKVPVLEFYFRWTP